MPVRVVSGTQMVIEVAAGALLWQTGAATAAPVPSVS
jgi:hypothetical protein